MMELKVKKFEELSAFEIYEILKSRSEVFMLEQNIICQDMDDVDFKSYHFFFENENRVAAYLRVFYSDETRNKAVIGRVLTLADMRGRGIGCELMEKAIEFIKNNMPCRSITLHSQKVAAGFYEKLGFKPASEEFLEEGVVHIAMEMNL